MSITSRILLNNAQKHTSVGPLHHTSVNSKNFNISEHPSVHGFKNEPDYWGMSQMSDTELKERQMGPYFSSYRLTDRQTQGLDMTVEQTRQMRDYNRLHIPNQELDKLLTIDSIARKSPNAKVSDYGFVSDYEPDFFMKKYMEMASKQGQPTMNRGRQAEAKFGDILAANEQQQDMQYE